MENLDLKTPLKFKDLWAKMMEIIKKRSKEFWTILFLFALPIAGVEAYLNYFSYAEVSQQLGQLDLNSEASITQMTNTALNATFTVTDYVISALASVFQILSLLMLIFLAYSYLLGGNSSKSGVLELLKVSLRNVVWVFLIYIFYSYASQLTFTLVGAEVMVILGVGIQVKSAAVLLASIILALGIGVAAALFINTYIAMYFYPMMICTGTGRTRASLAFPYMRAVLRGQKKRAFLQLLPWMVATGACHLGFLLTGLYYAGGNPALSVALFAVGSFLNSVLQGMMFLFLTAQFFNLEANSKAIIRVQKDMNGENNRPNGGDV